jgi:hypothetical protein
VEDSSNISTTDNQVHRVKLIVQKCEWNSGTTKVATEHLLRLLEFGNYKREECKYMIKSDLKLVLVL